MLNEFSSVAAQQGSDELKLLVVYVESEQYTGDDYRFLRIKFDKLRDMAPKYDMNRDLADAILQISTGTSHFSAFLMNI